MMGDNNRRPPLPKGWVWAEVGEVYDIIGGGTPSTRVEEYWQGDTPWISSADVHGVKDIRPRRRITEEAIANSATNLVPASSIIVVTRVGLGKLALTTCPICFSQDSQALVGNSDLIVPDYALHYLSQAVQMFKYRHRGTTIAGVTKKQLFELPFALSPLAEQRRIVAKIEELFSQLDAGVAALGKAKAQLQRYRQAVLKAAVSGELTREWREAHKNEVEPASDALRRIGRDGQDKLGNPRSLDTAGLPALPEQWIWGTLPQLGELNRGKSQHRPRNDPALYGGPYPFIQTGDVRAADGVIRRYHQTYSEEGLRQSRLWPAGTLCITIAANIADTAVLGFDACFPDSIVGFLADSSACDVRFVEFFFRTAKEDIDQYAPATAQKNINLRMLSSLPIPVPPAAEQRVIADRLGDFLFTAGAVEDVLDQSMAPAERLRQSVLKRAFEGKLVPQDPADEPASVLLERIKAGKGGREADTKQTGKQHKKKETDQPNLFS